jgi:hypothetical protein
MKSTKFIACIFGTTALIAAAFAGHFSGELGLAVSGMVCSYIGGNSYITGKALANGKETPA